MLSKNKLLIFLFLLASISIISHHYFISSNHYSKITSYFNIPEKLKDFIKEEKPFNNTHLLKELSKLLTQAVNQVGKLSCQLNNKSDGVSLNGGWCSNISGKSSHLHLTDTSLAIKISKYLKGKRVASFGDGPGKN